MTDFDLVVLGSGPGGYSAALRAASNGLNVGLIEKGELGGSCLNRGCVPAKAWIAAVETLDHAKLMRSIASEPFDYTVDFQKMASRQRKIVSQFRKSLEGLLQKRGVKIIEGKGRFVSQNRISVVNGSKEIFVNFKHAIIATGTAPAKLFDLPAEVAVTSKSVFELERAPDSLLIVGAGAIGCEFAGVFARLGVKVTMLELMPRILPTEDGEISALMEREFKKLKIKVVTGARIESMTANGGGVTATLDNGETYTADKTLVSIGRSFPTGSLGLDSAGVKVGEKGEIQTDDYMRTTAPGIYAVGDVAGKSLLAYTACRESAMAVDTIVSKPVSLEKPVVPSAIFTIPEIASVGLTQEQAPASAKVGTFMFRALARAHSTGEINGIVKVIADADSDLLLGAHIIGPRATDMIPIATLALTMKMTAKQLGALLFAHPTFAEAILEAVDDIHGQALHK